MRNKEISETDLTAGPLPPLPALLQRAPKAAKITKVSFKCPDGSADPGQMGGGVSWGVEIKLSQC